MGATAKGRVDIASPIPETLEIVARCYGRRVRDLTTIVLDRPRHEDLIEEIRSAGARIRLIPDGDITASLSVAVRGTGDHLYVGIGRLHRGRHHGRGPGVPRRRDPGPDVAARHRMTPPPSGVISID